MSEITTLVPWFGSNRTLAHEVGAALTGLKWVGIPFAGGMCEVSHITARSLVVSDLHRHLINLARVVASDQRPLLTKRLRKALFHPDELEDAQDWCESTQPVGACDLEAAYRYFVCCWMGRSANAGTDKEFSGGLSNRWNANGGDSNTRYRSAIRGLAEFSRQAARCNFVVLDVFEFLDRVLDTKDNGLYCDPPFPGAGDDYKHKFTIEQHRELARRLTLLSNMRVVCRFYDHELIRELYQEPHWKWKLLKGRKQSNKEGPEVLLVNQ